MLGEIIWNEGMLAVVMIFGIPIVSIIAGAWYKIAKTQSDNDLKRSMVERGMSVEEMERVIMLRPEKRSGRHETACSNE